jgi:hypothetical protein
MSEEKSPGGSTVRRYAQSEWAKPEISPPDEASIQFAQAREKAYAAMFGEARNVYHEVLPFHPHVDVYTFARSSPQGTVFALVTSGMSDLPLHLPPTVAKTAPRRVELIFYCSDPKKEYLETLRWVARFPHDQKTWLSFGHTLPNGNPPAPFWGSQILDTLLFMPTVVKRDQALPNELTLAGDPVQFLWVVPISTAECGLKLKKGFGSMLDLFEKHHHPHVFDPTRASYV